MYFKLYLLTRLDYLSGLFLTISIVLGIIFLIFSLVTTLEDNWDRPFFNKFKQRVILITITVSMILFCLTPTKEDYILIVGGGKAYEYIQSDTSLQKIPQLSTQYLKAFIEKETEKIKSETKK